MDKELRPEPWFVPAAVEWLEEVIEPGWRAFEWGAGGSTLWLASLCAEVVTVEHDPTWWARVYGSLGPDDPVKLWMIPATDEEPGEYASSCRAGSFRDYAEAIDGRGPFDLVLVDGRARNACLRHAVPEAGNVLVLDNAEREWYLKNNEALLEGWERRDFREGAWVTSAWTRS